MLLSFLFRSKTVIHISCCGGPRLIVPPSKRCSSVYTGIMLQQPGNTEPISIFTANCILSARMKIICETYRWGTGSLYFRNQYYTPVWLFDEEGHIHQPERFGDQDSVTKRALLHSRIYTIPDDWLVCNGFILPSNYIDVARFERIYQTHNRFRVFTSSPRKREEEMLRKMGEYRGVMMEDLEARKVCGDRCKQLFGTRDPRRLDTTQRITLAQQLRRQYRLTFRQLATLVRLPEVEIRTFVRY